MNTPHNITNKIVTGIILKGKWVFAAIFLLWAYAAHDRGDRIQGLIAVAAIIILFTVVESIKRADKPKNACMDCGAAGERPDDFFQYTDGIRCYHCACHMPGTPKAKRYIGRLKTYDHI